MVAPIRYLSRRSQQEKIGILQSTEDEKVLEVIGRVGIGTTIFDADYNLDVRGDVRIQGPLTVDQLTVTGGGNTLSDLTVQNDVIIGGGLTVTGISTFASNVDLNADLDVDGHTELDTLNVSIAATTASLTLANIGVAVTAILDEDDLVSDRDDALATQQSIKKYVDDQVTAQDLDFAGDSGTGSVDLDSETFTIAGTANEIETVGSGNTLTVGLPNEVNITTSLTVGSATTITGSGIIAGIVTGTLDNDLTLATSGTGLSGSATYNNSGVVTFTVTSDATDINTPSTIVSRDGSGNFSAGTISADLTGVASTATKLETSRTFELTGDVVASQISFDGTGNVSLAATIQPNSVALGDDTTGDYVSSISGTSNQIAVDVTSGEGTTPVISIPDNPTLPGTTVTIANDLQVNRDLNVNGNITIGGTSATLFTETLKVSDSDIILGFRTDAGGNDVSNDTTANHGGVAVASTEGSPLISLIGAGETLPTTYKKIMWFQQGSFAGLGTDAWLINYGVGIGSTQFPTGTRLAAGSVQFTENDLAVIRNINASGIVTATNGFVGNLTGTASTASNLTRSVIAGNGLTGGGELTADRTLTVGVGTGITINSDNVELRNSENLTGGTITKWDDGNGQLTDSLVTETGTIVNVGSGITFYTSTGIISATAYYGSGGNLEDIIKAKLEGITANFKPFDSGTVTLGDTLAVAEVDIIDNSTVGFITAVGFGSTAQYYFNDVTAVGLTTDASVNTTGIITSGGFTASGGVFTGDGSGLTNLGSVAAGVTVTDNDIVRGTASVLNFGSDIDVSLISAGIVTVSLNNNQNFTGIVTISTLGVSGVSTFTGTINANGNLDVDGHTELDDVNVSGVSTFASDVDINAGLDVDGHTELDELNVSGVSTFTDVEIDGVLYDSNNATGSNGQLLTSIGTGVSWTNTTTTAAGQNILNVSASDTYNLTSSDIVSGVATAGFISPTVVMTGTGSVGIGTTNPKVKLQIDGILGFGTVYDIDEELLYTNIRIGDETTGGGGFNNIFMGIGAGNSNIDGGDNNFLGKYAGYYNTTGNRNNFFGRSAGLSNTTGSCNNMIGNGAGRCATVTGSNNNFLGTYAGKCASGSGGDNNFIGNKAGYCNTEGSHNNFLGSSAGYYNTTGNCNNFFGNYAGHYNTTGSNNNFLGDCAGYCNTEGSCNNMIGRGAGQCATVYGSDNNFLGNFAGKCASLGGGCNNFFGRCAGFNNTEGGDNNFLGNRAGYRNTEGDSNNFFGSFAGYYNTEGSYNNFLGSSAGYYNTTGGCNNFFGNYAGHYNTTGNYNNFIGHYGGYNNTEGSHNNFLGTLAGYYNTVGSFNNFLGDRAGYYNTTGCYNNFIGHYGGYNNTTGCHNNFLGTYAGYENTTGSCNNFIGHCGGYYNTTGSCNNFFGSYAGFSNTTGNDNNFFGRDAGCDQTTGNNNVAIGYNVQLPNTTGSNQLVIGVGASAWINGDSSFNVGIGTTNPTSKLHVIGEVTATDYNSTSDARLKNNIQIIDDPLEKVLQINGVSFNWIEDNRPSLGVIADNIQEILPELVSDTDPKTVNYNGLIGLLIEVVKEQQAQIESLNERLTKLE
jgi:hypothetical protein